MNNQSNKNCRETKIGHRMNNQSNKGCRDIKIDNKMNNQSNKDCKEIKIDHNQIDIGVQQPLEMGCGINGISKKKTGD